MKRKELFSLRFEDQDMIVVDKAPGIAVIADRWDDSKERLDEVLNAYFAKDAEAAAKENPPRQPRLPFPHKVFVVHRIDKDTSGLVIFAKHAEAHKQLSALFESRTVAKTYVAIVHGRPSWDETICDLPLRADGDREHRTVIDKRLGKSALTRFRLLGTEGNYSVVEASPQSGRTHQIRVHLTSLGYPIVCDPLYGSPKPVLLSSFKRGYRGDRETELPILSRLGLHAARLELPRAGAPESPDGENPPRLVVMAPFPRDMGALIRQLEKSADGNFGLDEYFN